MPKSPPSIPCRVCQRSEAAAAQADALTSEPPGMHKFILRELQVKFYLGQNEDCSLGDSTSNSSEKMLQRGRGEDQ